MADIKYIDWDVIIPLIIAYVDDIIGGHIDKKTAMDQFNHCSEVLSALNLPTKPSKSKFPKQLQILLGKLFDTIRAWLFLPKIKVDKYIIKMLLSKTAIWLKLRPPMSYHSRLF